MADVYPVGESSPCGGRPARSLSSGEADALFVFIGTRPRTDWLPPEVLRDEKGFFHWRAEPLASAVGERSMVVRLAPEYLALTGTPDGL